MNFKLITFLVLNLCFFSNVSAQNPWTGADLDVFSYRQGNVGIGTMSSISGANLSIVPKEGPVSLILSRGKDFGKIQMGVAGCNTCFSTLTTSPEDVFIRADGSASNNMIITNQGNNDILFGIGTVNYEREIMRMYPDGKVKIGDVATPNGYTLYVAEGILTERVKVAISTSLDWMDIVFEDEYELLPLDDLNLFIKENKHLPNVPSADEMVENGLDVAKMDALLLQKIEELTLYVIDLNQQVQALQKELSEK